MFVLQLNDMRASQVEILTPVARVETREELEKCLKDNEVEPYRDGRWGKDYRQGGPLEWYNKPFYLNEALVDVSTEDSWAESARENFRSQIMMLPEVP